MQERAYQDAMIDMAVDTIVKDRAADYYRFSISVDDRVHANRTLNDHWRRRPAIVNACEWTTAQFPTASYANALSDGTRAHFGVIAFPVSRAVQVRLQGFLRCPNSLARQAATLSIYDERETREVHAPAGLATLARALTFRLQSKNLWIANEKLTDGRFRALSEDRQKRQQLRSYLAGGSRPGHAAWGDLEFLPHELFLQVRG